MRVPAPQCSFSLSFGFADPIPDAGLAGGFITLTPSASGCTSWSAYSPVDWISFATQSTTQAVMVVTANPSTGARSASVRVAGNDFTVTQQGKVEPPLIETGIVKNGTFDLDLANWGWQDRFPNGVGTSNWSNVDANGNSLSGSLLLTSVPGSVPGIQRLQCVQVTPATGYTFSFAYRMSATLPTAGLSAVSIFELESDDCSGPYSLSETGTYYPNGTNDWRRSTFSKPFRFGSRSALIVFASKTQTSAPFDLYVDDVIMKQ
ncbi:MAG TPA: BACON domain-containing carbohydrate-binding protein [Thermoanaerobaculia bacterium]|nr:BACON domain-containing carbohydrate-binding protein [Thermoanaerobaculia bacterium]